jgi:hypothetical protein
MRRKLHHAAGLSRGEWGVTAPRISSAETAKGSFGQCAMAGMKVIKLYCVFGLEMAWPAASDAVSYAAHARLPTARHRPALQKRRAIGGCCDHQVVMRKRNPDFARHFALTDQEENRNADACGPAVSVVKFRMERDSAGEY